MFRIVIIEDEEPAARRLLKMVKELVPETELLTTIESVKNGIKWLKSNPSPDMIFSDIQLSDGISFEIFNSVKPSCAVTFITAYDQYAIEAFKVNSIAYLLKPLKQNELQQAIEKYKSLTPVTQTTGIDYQQLIAAYEAKSSGYKKRFVVKFGEHLKTINTEDIAYCYTEDKVNFFHTHEGRRFVSDFNLDQLESFLPPEKFFRINRQYIISIAAIREMLSYSKARVKIILHPPTKEDTIVSTERAAAFKNWLSDGA